jgi:hypothetical protein
MSKVPQFNKKGAAVHKISIRSHNNTSAASFQCHVTSRHVTSVFFKSIPENAGAYVPSWQYFKHFFAAEIGVLHYQPLTNSHFHFFIIVTCRDKENAQCRRRLCRYVTVLQCHKRAALNVVTNCHSAFIHY